MGNKCRQKNKKKHLRRWLGVGTEQPSTQIKLKIKQYISDLCKICYNKARSSKIQLRYFLTLGCVIVLSSVGSLVSNKQWDDAVAFFVRRSLNADSLVYIAGFISWNLQQFGNLHKLYLSQIRLKAGHTPLHPISLGKHAKNEPKDVDNTKDETWFSSRLRPQKKLVQRLHHKWEMFHSAGL